MGRFTTRRNLILLATASSVAALLVVGLVLWLLRPPPRLAGIGDEFSFYDEKGRPISGRRGALGLVLDPATIYANWPSQRNEHFTIDERGFRATPRRELPQVFILGGSAAFGAGLPSDQVTFAWLLGESMTKYDVVNAAVIGFLPGQELALMTQRLDNPRAKAYVVFNGWNDLMDPFTQAPADRRPVPLLGFNNTFLLVQERLHELYRCDHAAPAKEDRLALQTASAMPDEQFVAAITRTCLRNLDRMHAFARARDAVFLAVFQPEIGHPRSEQEGRILSQAPWYSELHLTTRCAAMRTAAMKFCRARDIPCLDVQASPDFLAEPGTLFLDVVHLNARGHNLVAKLIEGRLRELISSAGHPSKHASPGQRQAPASRRQHRRIQGLKGGDAAEAHFSSSLALRHRHTGRGSIPCIYQWVKHRWPREYPLT
jgi:hypothetical protein